MIQLGPAGVAGGGRGRINPPPWGYGLFLDYGLGVISNLDAGSRKRVGRFQVDANILNHFYSHRDVNVVKLTQTRLNSIEWLSCFLYCIIFKAWFYRQLPGSSSINVGLFFYFKCGC